MEPGGTRNPLSQMRRGVLEYCVLSLLVGDSRYGFDLVRRLGDVDGMVTSEGTIYPLLSRLRREGWVTTTWVESEAGPPRRYYAITPAGRRAHGVRRRVAPLPRRRRPAAVRRGPMNIHTVDQLVSDYLGRLDTAAAVLPPDRRIELLEEIREHIDVARAAGAAADEAAVRTLLDRLGGPEEIVGAARDEQAPPHTVGATAPQTMVPTRPGTGLEITAVLMLTVGSFIPLIGWAVGVILLWSSRRWRTGEKLLGTLVVPGGPAVVLWLGVLVPGQVCSDTTGQRAGIMQSVEPHCTGFAFSPWIGLPLLLTALIAPFVVAGVLVARARARAALEPVLLRPASTAPTTAPPWGGGEIAAVVLLGLGGFLAIFGVPLVGLSAFVVAVIASLVGLVFVWTSTQWSSHEKTVGTVLAVVPAVLVAIVVVAIVVGGTLT